MSKIRKNKIWAIAGGKGGVGKSFFTTNISIDLAQKGYSVVLIDADFGGPNLHTFFGLNNSVISLSDFICSDQLHLDDVLQPTGIANLKLASGAHDVLAMSNPNTMQQNKLRQSIKALNADYIIIDLGAGTANFTIDLFLMADKHILITAPEPTSVENTYRFIKTAIYRKLKSVIRNPEVKVFLEKIEESKGEDLPKTPAELVADINRINAHSGEKLKYELAGFKPKLVLNQVRTPTDVRIGFSMRQACKKYFGINIGYAGFLEHDTAVTQSIRLRRPVLIYSPDSTTVKSIKRVSQNIRQNYHLVPN